MGRLRCRAGRGLLFSYSNHSRPKANEEFFVALPRLTEAGEGVAAFVDAPLLSFKLRRDLFHGSVEVGGERSF